MAILQHLPLLAEGPGGSMGGGIASAALFQLAVVIAAIAIPALIAFAALIAMIVGRPKNINSQSRVKK
jgi:hypothetical protein